MANEERQTYHFNYSSGRSDIDNNNFYIAYGISFFRDMFVNL